jgi:mannose/cellobiose epimerase-like protein (N-acyl-D-glucosamine 2-epimerase family)
MSEFPVLSRALAPMLAWTKQEALPFWGTVGVDHARGGFHERLDLQGHPIPDVPKRLMVQGRQLYVYCHAGLLGWHSNSRSLADRCVDYMVESFYRRDGNPGWAYSLTPDGRIASAVRDTYGHAFALLGLAWYHRLTGDAQVLRIADETLAFLDEALACEQGGYLDAAPPPDAVRRQNPHMHLFESVIALYQATCDPKYLARGAELFELFSARFFQPATGSLCEYFGEDLNPLPDQRGRVTEPGHHYEWVWLLRAFQRACGRDVGPYCKALYEHADRYGWDAEGFVVDEVENSGAVLKASRRSWPHTEALKANVAEGERGRGGCDEKAAACCARLMNAFVGRPVSGGWMDHIDSKGRPLVGMIPASTLYHLFMAVAEATRVTSKDGLNATAEPSLVSLPDRG